jgi:hypothetical protein
VGTVDGDFRNAIGFMIENIFVGFGGLPVDLHASLICHKS